MIMYDPLYGRFKISDALSTLVLTPEVRRLSQIRLLNTVSPSVATLGEIRRFSHTMGVLFLSQLSPLSSYTLEERAAFEASVLLHDIGTPPFAHLFEYHLKERESGWNHEDVIHSILWGFHAPENRAHQIFAGQPIQYRKVLSTLDISFDLVEAIVTRKHPLSELLFGTLDLDNLDNVARVGWALGLSGGPSIARQLAANLSVNPASHRIICPESCRADVRAWAALRKAVYDILVFDAPTVAAQAVLSEAIETLLTADALRLEDWSLTDEGLIDRLRGHPLTKRAIIKEYLGKLPQPVFCIQFAGNLKDIGFRTRGDLKRHVEIVLNDVFPKDRSLGYAFVDRGTFAKQIEFGEPGSGGGHWTEGDTSHSVVVYSFLRNARPVPMDKCNRAIQRFLDSISYEPRTCLRIVRGAGQGLHDEQRAFAFTTTLD